MNYSLHQQIFSSDIIKKSSKILNITFFSFFLFNENLLETMFPYNNYCFTNISIVLFFFLYNKFHINSLINFNNKSTQVTFYHCHKQTKLDKCVDDTITCIISWNIISIYIFILLSFYS